MSGGLESAGIGRGLAERRALTVSELTQQVKRLIDADPLLSSVLVRGELSNLRQPASGHMYFTLKDDSAALRCVMFRSANARLRFAPRDGLAVDVFGRVGVYPRDGQYQLYADDMRPAGIGDLHLAFEQLKARLAAEGLFDAAAKRSLPLLSRRVAVVTSATGAAVRDVLKVGARRCPGMRAVVVPVPVQGEGAADKIAAGLRAAATLPEVDAVILTRGGGSLEELWAFNEECVARAIRESPVPVIVGVGHEIDVTIACLAADVRAPTPSAAAELAFPDCSALGGHLSGIVFRLRAALHALSVRLRRRLDGLVQSPVLSRPQEVVGVRAQRLDSLVHSLLTAFVHRAERHRLKFGELAGRLDALSPLNVLGRGYAICTDSKTGAVISAARDAAPGTSVDVRLADGGLRCTVDELLAGPVRGGCED